MLFEFEVRSGPYPTSWRTSNSAHWRLLDRHRIGEAEPVEDARGLVADQQHRPVKAAFVLADAIPALFVGEPAGAGQQAERPPGQPHDLAIADVGRRPRQPIAALASAHRIDQAGAAHLRE